MALNADQYDLVVDAIAIYESQPERLTSFEKGFFESEYNGKTFLQKFDEFGEQMFVSEKQLAVLQRLVDKVQK